MRNMVLAVAAMALFAVPVFAQDIRAAAPAEPLNAAVKGVNENNSSTPVPGANSFTMSQAKSQIEAKGYTRVAGLKKGEDGVWRGRAMKGGTTGPVSVDFQGNVN